jgi:hypothetical protein
VGPRTGLDVIERGTFFIQPGLKLRPLGQTRSPSPYRLYHSQFIIQNRVSIRRKIGYELTVLLIQDGLGHPSNIPACTLTGTSAVCFHTNIVCCSILRTLFHQQCVLMFLTSSETSTGRQSKALAKEPHMLCTIHLDKTKYSVLSRRKHRLSLLQRPIS